MQVEVSLLIVQTIDGESERTEMIAHGTLDHTDNAIVLRYQEPPHEEEDGAAVTMTVRGNCVVIDRRSSMVSQLLLEEGKRHMCRYETPYGRLILHTQTSHLACSWHEHGGTIEATYALQMQDMHTDHTMEIRIKEVS